MSKRLFDKVMILLYIITYFTSMVGIEHGMWPWAEFMGNDRKCLTQFVRDTSGQECCCFL